MTISRTLTEFLDSERAGGVVLMICTLVSLVIVQSPVGMTYLGFWQTNVYAMTIEQWVNHALMTVFFLLIGLELERELYSGELSNLKNAMLPIVAAMGGVCVPALIHYSLNAGTPTQAGAGIPMATDIAFALGVLALLGTRIPLSLKVFLTALAVMDDLAAIIVIAVFYTDNLSFDYLAAALAVFAVLVLLNRPFRVMSMTPYVIGGVLMWVFLLKSGVHATIAGVLLAFAIPYSAKSDDEESPSHRLEHLLQKPVAFGVLPIFALANTGVLLTADWGHNLFDANSAGIIGGLVIGKPLGITLFSLVAVTLGLCALPGDLNWRHLFGAALLGGIGFTMSIFVTLLAFTGNAPVINASKIAILLASLAAGVLGYVWLRFFTPPTPLSSSASTGTSSSGRTR